MNLKFIYQIKIMINGSFGVTDNVTWVMRTWKKLEQKTLSLIKNHLINKGSFNEFCEDCTLGKLKKLPHKTVDKINKDPNHVVIHSYIVGPMRRSLLGSKDIF